MSQNAAGGGNVRPRARCGKGTHGSGLADGQLAAIGAGRRDVSGPAASEPAAARGSACVASAVRRLRAARGRRRHRDSVRLRNVQPGLLAARLRADGGDRPATGHLAGRARGASRARPLARVGAARRARHRRLRRTTDGHLRLAPAEDLDLGQRAARARGRDGAPDGHRPRLAQLARAVRPALLQASLRRLPPAITGRIPW
jgi:hypothetical protein